MTTRSHTPPASQRKRYHRIITFAAGVFGQTVWWDVILAFPLLGWLRSAPLKRWQAIARRYRHIATDMGGVLIKLGQFLSTRVDLFPPEITRELASLQDEALPAPYDGIAAVVEASFGAPIARVFPDFAAQPMGAASLAQAHEARLPTGEGVIVKVLRPQIHDIVETDLEALRRIVGWLKIFPQIRQRMDLDMLLEEFIRTTRAELDLQQEKENLKRFAADFSDVRHVYVPAIHEDFCKPAVLTLENVAYIKIGDMDAMTAAGIAPQRVAEVLYDAYMRQIFVSNFVHVDPHPGNLFVRPLPDTNEAADDCEDFRPGDKVPHCMNRPFQLVFIDFGMTAVISERLKTAMRTAAIGLGTQDAHKVIQAYVVAGALKPGTDLRRLEEIHQDWLRAHLGAAPGENPGNRLPGNALFLAGIPGYHRRGPFSDPGRHAAHRASGRYFIGPGHAPGPGFRPLDQDPALCPPVCQRRTDRRLAGHLGRIVHAGAPPLAYSRPAGSSAYPRPPGRPDDPGFPVPRDPAAIRRIDLSVKRFAWMVLTVGLLVSGVNLHIAGKNPPFGILLMVLSVVFFLWGMGKK
jgi:predicted unusual protein kinase regulating ubiquinone biosynthesis (AarF/ABC1/UbiB family)